MADRGRCKAVRLGLHILLLAATVTGQWPSIHLDRTLRVQRGLTADIKPLLTISGLENPQLTHCSIRQVPHTAYLSCGDLRPSWMQCDSSGPLVYRHHGCSATRELLYLQLLASKNDSATTEGEPEDHVMFSSVEVIVGDLHRRLVYLETSTRLSEGYEYTQLTPIFPPEWVGKCYYRTVHSVLLTAVIQGMVGSPLPCGYVPREQFRLLENAGKNRSVLFEVTGTSSSMPGMLRVLLFANSPQDEEDYLHTLPLVLPHTTLHVLQFSNTPVPENLFPCPHSYHQCVYVFPALQAGAFVPAYSPAKPQSRHTKFTSEDIAAGIVVFIPNEDPLTNTYEYSIFDYAGHMLAQSAVEVSVLQRNWRLPSQRFVTSPQIPCGGHIVLNDSHLQFYIQPDSFCMENTFVSLMRIPIHGSWGFADGRSLMVNETFPHTYLENGLLTYQHNGDECTVADGTVWTVTCDGKSFQVHMSLIIIPGRNEWSPVTEVHPGTLITFCGMASPLLLDTTVYTEPALRFDVNASEGTCVRLSSTNLPSGLSLPPYIPSSNLVSEQLVTQFSIEEVQRSRIWYIPVCSVPNSLELHIHVPGRTLTTTLRLQVLSSTVSLKDFFLVSSSDDFLKLVRNQALPIISSSPVFITTSFLYTHSHSDSPSMITYRVLTPPRYGHICQSSASHCTQSLDHFTQADVDAFMVVYRPAETDTLLHNDSFEFELRYMDIRLVSPFTSVFQIYTAQLEPLVPPKQQLWMEIGEVLNIPLRYFRPPYHKLQRRAIFYILTPPQFGELLVYNQSTFTFDDIRRERLQYRHHGENRECSDSFTFIASNSTHSITTTVMIAIRQHHNNLLGIERETKVVLAQDNFVFTSQDFQVLSDFCPRFVQFTMQGEPRFGFLRLFLPSLYTFIKLGNSSVFTEKDIRLGRLWYTMHLDPLNRANESYTPSDGLKFYLSDPLRVRLHRRINFVFMVSFVQPTESIHIDTFFNIRDVYDLSWLPEQQRYGYVFQPNDIHVNSTPDLQANHISVKILIKVPPKKGWIRKGNKPVTDFYLHSLEEGQINYVPTDFWIWVASSDTFTISILLETNNASVFIDTGYNHSMALVWSWVHPIHSSYFVQESSTELELTFRRRVDSGSCPDYESNFTLGFLPTNATLNTDCSSQWTGDACINSLDLSFSPGNCSLTVTMELAQDQIFEAREQLLMFIANCSNCVSNVTSVQPVEIIIDDSSDYAYVDVVTDATHSVVYGCSREISVREDVGDLELNLIRTINMEHEVNVSCSTHADTASEGVDFELLDQNSTVTFAPYQTSAKCIVGIYDDTTYERKERFYVSLRAAGGLVNTALSETSLCIYIVYDPSDAPILSFQQQPLIVRESESSNFIIFRSGVNLHLKTNVCYQVMDGTFPRATAGVDFTLINSISPTQSCVRFAPNQTEVSCTLAVVPDNQLEGTEFVFLELLHFHLLYGELGWPVELNITIQDGTQPAHIGLNSTTFHIDEGEGPRHFPIIRSGSTDGINKVLCKLKPINTTAQITEQNIGDFVVPRRPETVTFQPSNTTQYCSMWLKDDNVYEGVEALYLELDKTPLDPGVQIVTGRRRAIIYIHDTDDEPKVWFSSANYTVQEPLSNFEVDRRCVSLTLLRSGDLAHSFTISYTTVAGSARPGEHYVPVNGTIQFDPDEDMHTLSVPILANEDSSEVSFRVRLLTDVVVEPTDSLPRAAEPSEASVVIMNTPITGVLFPDEPIVVSLLANGSYATGPSLLYNAPVVCVDPCDKDFETIADTSYMAYCIDQQIASSVTKYTWYVSSNGLDYHPIRQATIFTSSDGKVLEPVYLNQSIYVRCSARAVTTSGTQGGTRHSTGVRLSHTTLSSEMRNSVSSFFELYKSDGFTGHPEELLRLTVVLKHYDNYVPLISSRPFDLSDSDLFLSLLTRPYSRDQHSCSNLVESGSQKASFLSPLPTLPTSSSSSFTESSSVPSSARARKSQLLYQHLNSNKCQWEFQVWLPLSLLTDSTVCNAQHAEEGQMSTLTLTLYYAYIHIRPDGGISVLPLASHNDQVRADWQSGHKLSIPFDTYPCTVSGAVHNTSTYIYPIMTQLARGLLTIFFYSISDSGGPIHRVEVVGARDIKLSGQLLYSSSTASSSMVVRQAWMLEEVPSDKEVPISLHLWHECCSGPLYFSWFVSTTNSFEPLIAPHMSGEIETADGLIEGRVWLQPYFHLRSDHALYLESATLYLCADPVNSTTCQIWTIAHHDEETVVAAGFDMMPASPTTSSLTFTFSAEPLQQLDLMGPFHLEIRCSIQHLSSPNPTRSPVHPLTLPFHFSEPDPKPSTSPGVSHNIALLASSITIFVTAAVIVAVVLAAVGVHWRWQARRKRNAVIREAEVVNEGEGANILEHRERTGHTLRKSSSTTSFPTAEKLKTHLQQQITSDRLHTTSQMTGQIDRGPFLSKSLPNLFLASSKEGQSRRRQLRKPATNVRVKAIYTLQASLNKWRGSEKEVAVVGGGNDREGAGRGSSKEVAGLEQGREKDLQVCVIKNSLHASPIRVCVQPLTGEVDDCSTASVLKLEPGSAPTTEL